MRTKDNDRNTCNSEYSAQAKAWQLPCHFPYVYKNIQAKYTMDKGEKNKNLLKNY
ncbi:hypothetical protein [Clostridium botulinum]|uniref:hypothetical protein n=1 Tax=Clostridium botulinum TaxID=1491 RepID=UPI00020755B8|nr:hypothetical protein [Clostridium botulinum]AEB77280.1 hypothetical protein CbC4_4080 [Clostridium botulinum BKT015925]KLU74377.1 hypothetical protein CBC3_p0079 [Clostridium botulinum V891]MCD3196387.1 hypothetical protein [Clostridium botulinum C/D]MCD3203371.1 hypothetical protein [Clostridium botulinum C/D]MCD3209911.1 hypothetical protein [Clostridium botulinum C/D]